jgi:hypothetical protein
MGKRAKLFVLKIELDRVLTSEGVAKLLHQVQERVKSTNAVASKASLGESIEAKDGGVVGRWAVTY